MKTTLQQLYQDSLVLFTDYYQLAMAYGYWKSGKHEHEAIFNLSFRRAPFEGSFAICAGLATAIEYLSAWRFHADDLAYLESLTDQKGNLRFEKAFLDYLQHLQFSCDIEAIEEGSVVFPHEPLLRIKGPLLQCQLLETPLLNIINFQTLIATKAARVCQAARGEPVLEFGARRAHGMDGGVSASRAAYIGGCQATSNVLAGKFYDIPLAGTHSHSWVMCFYDELEAFKAYAEVWPENCVFLVDTYDTLQGVQHAIAIGLWLKQQGKMLRGIRLDSGDLAYLSTEARKLLDQAGLVETKIFASNDLDEHLITNLKEQHAHITLWGVGTKLATAAGTAALDGVYKLTAIRHPNENWQYKLKVSEQAIKISTPGILRVRRYYNDQGAIADVIYDEQFGLAEEYFIIHPLDITHRRKIPARTPYQELLQPIFHEGKLVYATPALPIIQQKAQIQLQQFHESIKRFLNPHTYPVGLEANLHEFKTELIIKARKKVAAKKALLIVDLQNDFMPGGALAVPRADEIVAGINALQRCFNIIIASQDWHPANHGSFAANHPGRQPGENIQLAGLTQILWPIHCVQGTWGAEFVAAFNTMRICKVIHKGTDAQIDSYSAFFDNAHRKSTGLEQYLKKLEIDTLYIVGIATDYCVKFSVCDALKLGFKTYVIEDLCRAVNLQPDDAQKSWLAMQQAGAVIIKSPNILADTECVN